MVKCRSTYRIEGLDDLERHVRKVSDSVGCGEGFDNASSPDFFLLRCQVGLGLEGVTLSPAASKLVAREC
jgi:hypothetical protein